MSNESNSCDCCQHPTAEVKEYQVHTEYMHGTSTEPRWLCGLCASTMASNAMCYPSQYRGQVETLAAISFVGNTILAAIQEMKK